MPDIYVNPAGQRDNIGDSVLRRPYLETLRTAGTLHVLAGDHDDYNSGLGLSPADHVYTSKARWLIAASRSALSREFIFAANAGEVVGVAKEWLRSLWQPALSILANTFGRGVVLMGVSIRPGSDVRWTHLRFLGRVARVSTWRDRATNHMVGEGRNQPDWAFGIESSPPQTKTRNLLIVSTRGDRLQPDHSMVNQLRMAAEKNDLTIVVPVQVRRDADAARALAERLGGEVLEWPHDRTHREQEIQLRDLYRRAAIAVSDRIHVLILAMTEGAVPIGMTLTSPEKLTRTFDEVFPLKIIEAATDVGPAIENAMLKSDQVNRSLRTARARLAGFRTEFQNAFATPDPKTPAQHYATGGGTNA